MGRMPPISEKDDPETVAAKQARARRLAQIKIEEAYRALIRAKDKLADAARFCHEWSLMEAVDLSTARYVTKDVVDLVGLHRSEEVR